MNKFFKLTFLSILFFSGHICALGDDISPEVRQTVLKIMDDKADQAIKMGSATVLALLINFIPDQIKDPVQVAGTTLITGGGVLLTAGGLLRKINKFFDPESGNNRCRQESEMREKVIRFQEAFHNCQTKLCKSKVTMVADAYGTDKPYAKQKLKESGLSLWSNDPALPTKLFFLESKLCYQRSQDKKRAAMFAKIAERQSLFN